jgi:hypothetical protein
MECSYLCALDAVAEDELASAEGALAVPQVAEVGTAPLLQLLQRLPHAAPLSAGIVGPGYQIAEFRGLYRVIARRGKRLGVLLRTVERRNKNLAETEVVIGAADMSTHLHLRQYTL